jgi:hypothetical protein
MSDSFYRAVCVYWMGYSVVCVYGYVLMSVYVYWIGSSVVCM